MIPLVDLKTQYNNIKAEVQEAVSAAVESMAFINGPQIRQFEADFAKISGAKHGVGTSSGTTALQLALAALGIEQGDEIITVPNTFIATTEAITHSGAKVVFVDIDEKTYNIDVNKIEAVITEKTKAIIPVHIFGQPVCIDQIQAIAKKYNLKVIYDAAQAHLSEFNSKPIGGFGDCVCYSFYPGKNLGAYGDGGIVLTNNDELAKRMHMLVDHGRIDKYEHLLEGFNYRLSEVQAAILNIKLKYLPEWTKQRQKNADSYNSLLKDTGVVTPVCDERMSHVYHLYVIRVNNRDEVLKALHDKKIGAGVHYPIPLHLQKAYSYLNYAQGQFPVAEKASNEILSLPMFPELTLDQQQTIVTALSEILEEVGGSVTEHV